MKDDQNNLNITEEDSIDIIALLKKVWGERKLIIKVCVSFFLIGFIIAILSPVVYTSETTFVPQVGDDEMPQNSRLGSLASIAGINLSPSEKSDSYLSPLVYRNYNFITAEDYSLLKSFRGKFSIVLNDKEGYIKVLASDKNPFISSQLAEQVTKSLQSKIIEIRTNKIKERLKFSKEQYELKKVEFEVLQKKLAEFKDSNKNISTASFMSELQKLDSEYQLQQNILINLASVYNENKIKLNKNTPIFSVIDEVSVPNSRTKPLRGRIVTMYTFLGLVLSICFVLIKDSVIDLIKKLKD